MQFFSSIKLLFLPIKLHPKHPKEYNSWILVLTRSENSTIDFVVNMTLLIILEHMILEPNQ